MIPCITLTPPSPVPNQATSRSCAGGLLVMVCDAALRHAVCAEVAHRAERHESARASRARAQGILLELMVSVDQAAEPDLSEAVRTACQHLINDLAEAAGPGWFRRVRRNLSRLRDALARADAARAADTCECGARLFPANAL